MVKKMKRNYSRAREYYAMADDGHDHIEWTFYSRYRAGSKANEMDAIQEYTKKHGFYSARRFLTIDIRLIKE